MNIGKNNKEMPNCNHLFSNYVAKSRTNKQSRLRRLLLRTLNWLQLPTLHIPPTETVNAPIPPNARRELNFDQDRIEGHTRRNAQLANQSPVAMRQRLS
ncbi:unnamed protein product [Caenorhabditis angaria]|uniref:Uncharacterized protein n=1 Tax=Caenorhabditis angaria TaxID=860376 RepID=A0A9P1J0Q2_9PELO|nr:unnamed protein product [Caenorhabditis angaria]